MLPTPTAIKRTASVPAATLPAGATTTTARSARAPSADEIRLLALRKDLELISAEVEESNLSPYNNQDQHDKEEDTVDNKYEQSKGYVEDHQREGAEVDSDINNENGLEIAPTWAELQRQREALCLERRALEMDKTQLRDGQEQLQAERQQLLRDRESLKAERERLYAQFSAVLSNISKALD